MHTHIIVSSMRFRESRCWSTPGSHHLLFFPLLYPALRNKNLQYHLWITLLDRINFPSAKIDLSVLLMPSCSIVGKFCVKIVIKIRLFIPWSCSRHDGKYWDKRKVAHQDKVKFLFPFRSFPNFRSVNFCQASQTKAAYEKQQHPFVRSRC